MIRQQSHLVALAAEIELVNEAYNSTAHTRLVQNVSSTEANEPGSHTRSPVWPKQERGARQTDQQYNQHELRT
jgi:hypothetical protein